MSTAKPPTGEAILLKIGELTNGVRTPVAEPLSIVGTSTGYQVGEQEISTREFGREAALWDDGAVIAKNWQMPVQTNYRPEEDGNNLLEDKGLTNEEVYVELYPLGEEEGQPFFYGYATVNGFQGGFPRDGAITASATLQGRADLTKDTVGP